MKYGKRYLLGLILITVALILSGSAKTAKAAERTTLDVSKGDIVITKDGIYQLTGTTDEYNITVKSGVKASLYMGGVNINLPFYKEKTPILVESNAVVNVIVKGTNELINKTYDGNAISLQKDAKLSISKYSSGTLSVKGTGSGSGIGGTGTLYILGGEISAEGGIFGPGLGNALNPDSFSLYIRGGMITCYGGLDTTRMDNWYYDNSKSQLTTNQVYDICAKTFVITGGHLMASTYSSVPKNALGKEVYPFYMNAKTGKITKVSMDGKTYGSQGITSKGYLCLWGVSQGIDKIELTYQDGSKEIIEPGSYAMQGLTIDRNKEIDLSVSDIIILEHGYIYQNQVYKMAGYEAIPPLMISGDSKDHQIIVHAKQQVLILNQVSAKTTKQGKPIMIACPDTKLTLIIRGKNTIEANNQNMGIIVGNHAQVSIMADSEQDMLTFVLSNQSAGVNTACGEVVIYQGTVTANCADQSVGFELGNEGAFTLNGGIVSQTMAEQSETAEKTELTYENKHKTGKLIDGDLRMKVTIHGGELSAVSIGAWEEANEEVIDNSCYVQIGGTVTVTNRMIFGHITVYCGKLTAHLAGSGSGSEFTQYEGKVVMDRFISDFNLGNEFEDNSYLYDFQTGELTGSAIDSEKLYGGTLIETMKVEKEELKAISYGRC